MLSNMPQTIVRIRTRFRVDRFEARGSSINLFVRRPINIQLVDWLKPTQHVLQLVQPDEAIKRCFGVATFMRLDGLTKRTKSVGVRLYRVVDRRNRRVL